MKLSSLPWWGELGVRLAAVALVPAVAVGLLLTVVTRFTELPEGAAFRVGDAVVSEDGLRDRVDVLEALYGIRAPAGGPEVDEFRRLTAKTVAVSMIIDRAAQERALIVTDAEAQQALDALIGQLRVPDGRAGFVRLLGRIGASEQDVLDEIKRREIHARLFDQVRATVPEPTDADVRRAFDERRSQMVVPEQRRIRNVVTASRQQADAALERARSGGDFTALAREFSVDQATRENGGDLGLVTRDDLMPAYADAAFATPAGVHFGPVETEFGWSVGQVVEIVPGRPLSFEEAAADLRGSLRSERALEAWTSWLGERIREADVEYAPEYEPADPDSPLPDSTSTAPPVLEGEQR